MSNGQRPESGTAEDLHEVAAQLGYSSAASLRRRNPDICDQIPPGTGKQRSGLRCPIDRGSFQRRDKASAMPGTRPQAASPARPAARNSGSKRRLSYRFPQLCRAFAVANREEREQRLAPMRAAIEAALTEWPPPTVRDLISRFGCTEAALKYRFPDLYSAALTRLPERKQFFDEQTIVLMQRASKEEPAPPGADCRGTYGQKRSLPACASRRSFQNNQDSSRRATEGGRGQPPHRIPN